MLDHPSQFSKKFIASLFNSLEANLKTFDFVPVGSGQVGDCFRVNLDWKEKNNLPTSFIAKCPAADQSSRDTARNLHLYEIETSFYKYLSNKCSARVPELYYSDFDSNSDDGILLLEDMHPAKQIPQMDGCTAKEVSQVLKEAAALHKSYWNDEKLLSYPWLTYGVSEERKEFVANLLPAVYPEWKQRYQGRISEDIFEMGDALIANYDKYSEVREGPMTLVQGDLRLDNILFVDQNNRAILLDWQTAAVGLPLNDVAYCISTSFDNPNDRADSEESLVKEYHSSLNIEESYSFEDAWNDYRRGSFVGFLMAVMSAMIVERTERGDEMFAVMAERSGWQALHLDAVSFLK
jgi:hypothetical protein